MSSEPRRQTIQSPDGRQLDVVSAGAHDGRCLLVHSGTPSGAEIFGPMADAAAARGMFVLTFSRPGYGESTVMAGRAVSDVATDVQAILDAFKVDSFFCAGLSGGGPHALACAALLADRAIATATLGGVAPYPAAGIDWLAGMDAENIEEFNLSLQGEDALTPYLEREAAVLSNVQPEAVIAAFGGLVSDVDKASLTGEYAAHMADSLRRAVSTGIAGWRDDDLAFVRPWGFDVAAITTPVAIWQGGEDRMVPMSHGAWLADHIPNAERHLLPTEGHLSIRINEFGNVLDGLLAMGAASQHPAHAS